MISSNFPAFIISLIAQKHSVYAALKADEHTLNNAIQMKRIHAIS
jgi:hypothetical protein